MFQMRTITAAKGKKPRGRTATMAPTNSGKEEEDTVWCVSHTNYLILLCLIKGASRYDVRIRSGEGSMEKPM